MNQHAEILTRLAQMVARAPRDAPLAGRMCRAIVEILGADGGALTIAATDPERLTVFTSDGNSERYENLQEVLGEGPGQDAYSNGEVVVTEVDGFTGGPFPMFTELAGDVAGSVHLSAIPLRAGGSTLGVMTLYRAEGEIDASAERLQFLGDAVGAALTGERETRDVLGAEGWPARSRIHQATGMVAAQLAVTTDDALALLRAHAFAHTTSLDDVAADVVTRRIAFSQAPDGSDIGGNIENSAVDRGAANGEA